MSRLGIFAWSMLVAVGLRPLSAGEEEKFPPPKPFVFSLGGIPDKEIQALKSVPGVEESSIEEGRFRVVYQPFNNNPWCKASEGKPKWIKGAEKFYEFLPIKKKIGQTRWTHGNLFDINSDTIIWYGPILSGSKGYPLVFKFMFDNFRTKRNEVMSLKCYSDAEPAQLEHEMVRKLIGLPIRLEKCGKGYVLVGSDGNEDRVAWQVNDQSFIQIDSCFDRDMVAAYIERFGCITTNDYKVSLDTWVENEIRWRIKQLDFAYERNMFSGYRRLSFVEFLISYFPSVGQKFGNMNGEVSLREQWQYLHNCRNFLWANKGNFKYEQNAGWFVLKGKDLFDPEHPPELPDELHGPPPPTEEQVRKSEQAAQSRARKMFEDALRAQFKEWNEQFQSLLKEDKNWQNMDVRYPFEELRILLQKRQPMRSRRETEDWLHEARGWLWSNRENFEWRDGGYFLRGPDQYDPMKPPEIPTEFPDQTNTMQTER